ncbi:MAG: hypothetical protein ACR2QW_03620 [bacterium]
MSAISRFRTRRLLLISGVLALVFWIAAFVLNRNLELGFNEYLWWVLIGVGSYGVFCYLQYRCPVCGLFPEGDEAVASFYPERCHNCGVVLCKAKDPM